MDYGSSYDFTGRLCEEEHFIKFIVFAGLGSACFGNMLQYRELCSR